MDRSLSFLENRLTVAIKLANLRIFEASSRDLRYKGMGTTCVSALISGERVYVAHTGDSRCYRVRDGAIAQLTRDHSLLEDYKEAKPDMTEEEEKAFPHKNVITRALGMRDNVDVAIQSHAIARGDMYLLCTDGLSGMVDDPKILEIVVAAGSLERAVGELVDAANRNGGVDNITALVIQCLET
jgi:protein phosphatase